MMAEQPIRVLAEVRSGGGAPQQQEAFGREGHPFVRAGSLIKLLDGMPEEELEHLSASTAFANGLKLFPANTVLFAKSGMSATKGHIYRLREPAYIVNHLAALVPHDDADAAFIVRALQYRPPSTLIKDEAYPSIRLGDIEEMTLPVPPDPADRRRIAAILDQADALRAKRRAALAQLDNMARAIFVEMFGDPIENNLGLPVQPLESFVDAARPITYGILMPGPDQPNGIPYVRVVDMANGSVNLNTVRRTSREIARQYERSKLKPGDLLISIRGHVGRVSLTPNELSDANITQDTARLAIVDAEPIFVKGLLESNAIREWMARRTKGAAVQGLNLGDLKKLPVLSAPMDKQRLYSSRVRQIRSLIIGGFAQLSQFDSLFASLQHRAFRGEL